MFLDYASIAEEEEEDGYGSMRFGVPLGPGLSGGCVMRFLRGKSCK